MKMRKAHSLEIYSQRKKNPRILDETWHMKALSLTHITTNSSSPFSIKPSCLKIVLKIFFFPREEQYFRWQRGNTGDSKEFNIDKILWFCSSFFLHYNLFSSEFFMGCVLQGKMAQTKQALRSKWISKTTWNEEWTFKQLRGNISLLWTLEVCMNWQYFLSGRSSQLSTALMKTQRGDQRCDLERDWTHNGAIKSKCFLNMGLSQGSKELLQQSVYLLAKVLIFITLLRTKNQCWYLVVSFPQLCYHHQ